MTRSRALLVLCCGLVAASTWLASADQKAAVPAAKSVADNRQSDRDAILAMLNQFRDAFQKKDAAAAVALMTAEAELIPDEGAPLKGREAIRKAYAAHFTAAKPATFKIVPNNLRFTSHDTAIEEGRMTVTRESEAPDVNDYHILYVREDGKWLISVIKETDVVGSELDDLDWLIGTWNAKQGEGEVTNSYEWFGNKSFIKATIDVRGKQRSFSTMQLIGLDPMSGEIRTWTFEHDGGLGEGSIRRDGARWIFENVAILSGGAVLETTNILVPVNKDTITWQSINLTIDGESVGNLPPTKLTRVKK